MKQHAAGRVHPKFVEHLGIQQGQENHFLESRQVVIQPSNLQQGREASQGCSIQLHGKVQFISSRRLGPSDEAVG